MAKELYVGNISWDTTQERLKAHFEQVGAVIDAKILTDRETGRSRGFGFVTLGSDEEAQEAINSLDGVELDDRPLRVNEARGKQPRPGSRPSPSDDDGNR